MTIYDHVLGGLLGAAVGDSMGGTTENSNTAGIFEMYGGYVTDFKIPPESSFSHGFPLGSYSDDFSMIEKLIREIVLRNGEIDDALAEQSLISWYTDGRYLQQTGPTMKKCLSRLLHDTTLMVPNFVNPYSKRKIPIAFDAEDASNGAAMKILPIGLLANGDEEKAVRNAIIVSRPSHENNSATDGAAAVAAAVTRAMIDGTTVMDMFEAGLRGAELAEKEMQKKKKILNAPNMCCQMELAAHVALQCDNMEDAFHQLIRWVGGGLPAYQAVPIAFGLLIAGNGDVEKCLFGGVNCAADADTVAAICCGMAGTLRGPAKMPKHWLTTINSANSCDIEALAADFVRVIS